MKRLVVLAVLALAASSAPPAAAATPSLKFLVVQSADVSNVFGTPFKKHQQYALAAQDLQVVGLLGIFTGGGKGWIEGYTSDFHSPVRPLQSGLTLVVSTISRYSTAASPQATVNSLFRSRATIVAQMQGYGVKNLEIVRLHGVGNTAVMGTSISAVKKGSLAIVDVVFVRGRFAGTVDLYGTSRLSKQQAVSLALLMDHRIQHAK